MKRFLAVLAAVILICANITACGQTGGAKYDVTNYRDVRNAIAVVHTSLYLYDSDGEMVNGWGKQGTGFFIGKAGEDPQYIVTNHHVVEDYVNLGKGELVEVSDPNNPSVVAAQSMIRIFFDSNTYLEGYVVDSDETKDIAIVKLDKPTDLREPVALMKPSDDLVGTTAYAVGYPGLAENAALNPVDQWSATDATVTSGSISRLLTTSGTGVRSLQVDINFTHGNSGGPLVTEDGYAIGINSWSFNEVYGVTLNLETIDVDQIDMATAYYSVDISEVIDMLTKQGIEFDEVGASGSGKNGLSTTTIIIIVAAVVVVAIIVVVIVAVSGSSKRKAPPIPSQPPVTPQLKSPVPPTPGPGPAAIAGDSGFRVQGVSGVYEGKRYALVNGKPMTFGRKEGIVIRYPDGTPGVSGEHCTIWVENGVVFIRDGAPGKPSTHGTFVNQTKLAGGQTVQLKVGDTVAIGSPKESFVIAVKG